MILIINSIYLFREIKSFIWKLEALAESLLLTYNIGNSAMSIPY
ncbi:MAG: hypothetical protein QNK70_06925 [Crocinitomicaceae bacterium]